MAISFSPGVLSFELDANQRGCREIIINSNSPTISISDKWAENKDMAWNSKDFNKTHNYHGIYLDYPKKMNSKDKHFQVCISGKYSGEYHGSITLKEEQVGNTIMQGGVWLNVTIKGTNFKPKNWTEDMEETSQIINESVEKKIFGNSPITGAVISTLGTLKQNMIFIIAIFISIIVITYIVILIYNKIKKRDLWDV